MNQAQEQKIKALIGSSKILSGQERAEWLALLELMDDRQMGELEKILTGDGQLKVESGKLKVESGQQTNPIAASSAKSNLTAPVQLPSLKHIVNLPRFGGQTTPLRPPEADFGGQVGKIGESDFAKATSDESSDKPESRRSDFSSAGQGLKKKNNFSDRLKSMFAEKELPAPKPELELEPPSKPAANIVAKPPALKLVPPPPPLRPKIPFAPPAPPVVISQPQGPMPAASPSLEFNDLTDLPRFDVKTLQKNDLAVLTGKIQNLCRRFGYFDVIFNLEKSPVYKTYIDTGLKSLQQKSGFDQLTGGFYLSKDQFEKFADLLVRIQSS